LAAPAGMSQRICFRLQSSSYEATTTTSSTALLAHEWIKSRLGELERLEATSIATQVRRNREREREKERETHLNRLGEVERFEATAIATQVCVCVCVCMCVYVCVCVCMCVLVERLEATAIE
jgi:hypothetical protein